MSGGPPGTSAGAPTCHESMAPTGPSRIAITRLAIRSVSGAAAPTTRPSGPRHTPHEPGSRRYGPSRGPRPYNPPEPVEGWWRMTGGLKRLRKHKAGLVEVLHPHHTGDFRHGVVLLQPFDGAAQCGVGCSVADEDELGVVTAAFLAHVLDGDPVIGEDLGDSGEHTGT